METSFELAGGFNFILYSNLHSSMRGNVNNARALGFYRYRERAQRDSLM
jgi:hypothetical protein